MRFAPKYGLLGWLLAKVAMKPQFARVIRQILDGLERDVAAEPSAEAGAGMARTLA